MSQPDRTADDNTTSLDLRDWHKADRPACANSTNWSIWIIGPPGYACPTCDWWCSCE